MSLDAMKQALEALDFVYTNGDEWARDNLSYTMQTLRLAIEQAEREESYWQEEARRYAGNADFWREKAKRQPLTEEEIVQLLGNVRESISGNVFLAFARAIERAHGIGGEHD